MGRRDFSTSYLAGAGDGAGAGVDGGAIGAERGALPVVLGGVIGELIGALPVVVLGVLLAVVGLLFQPAIRMIAIKTTTAMPAIHPHMPPEVSGRRSTGSLSRWSKRGSDMANPPWVPDVAPRSKRTDHVPRKQNPRAIPAVPKKSEMHRGDAELRRAAVKTM